MFRNFPWGLEIRAKYSEALYCSHMYCILGFPGGSDGKDFACNAEDSGWISGSGRSPGEGKGYQL